MNDLELPVVERPSYRWLSVADGNLDELPEQLCPTDNCPSCGAAWVEYVAVGWVPYVRPPIIHGVFRREAWRVEATGRDLVPIMSVRVVCHGEHRFDFDGRELWPAPVLSWRDAIVGTGALMIAAYMMPYVMGFRKK